MKCFLGNSRCMHSEWCCHFCSLKCDERCKDEHEHCPWFVDSPVAERDEDGNIRLFKYVEHADGTFERRYLSSEEIANELLLLSEKRNSTCRPVSIKNHSTSAKK